MITAKDVLVTEKSKMNFLKGLVRVAKCDNDISEAEKVYFDQEADMLELDSKVKKEINSLWNTSNIKVEFDSTKEKMYLITQLVQLCWVDGEYADSEKREITKLASEMGISKEAVVAVENWVSEGMAWSNKGEALLNLN